MSDDDDLGSMNVYMVNTAITPPIFWYDASLIGMPNLKYRVRQFSCTAPRTSSLVVPVVDFPSGPQTQAVGQIWGGRFQLAGIQAGAYPDPTGLGWYNMQSWSDGNAMHHRMPGGGASAVNPDLMPQFTSTLLTILNPGFTVQGFCDLAGYPSGTNSLTFMSFQVNSYPGRILHLQQQPPLQ